MQHWHVRPATLADIDTLLRFQQAMAQETEGWKLDTEVLERGILQTLLDPNKGQYWVAEVPNAGKKDKPVGCLMTQYEWSDWRCQNIVWIQSVYVQRENRQNGVFRALYQKIWAKVKQDPALSGIRLYVEKENKPALTAYHALGMESEHYRLCEQMKDF